jgi:hypothetical protein
MVVCGSSTLHPAPSPGFFLGRFGLGFQIHLSIQQGGPAGTDGFHHIPQGIGAQAGIPGNDGPCGTARPSRAGFATESRL